MCDSVRLLYLLTSQQAKIIRTKTHFRLKLLLRPRALRVTALRVMQDLLRVAAAHLVAVRTAVQVFAAARSQVGAHLQPYVMGPIMTVCHRACYRNRDWMCCGVTSGAP